MAYTLERVDKETAHMGGFKVRTFDMDVSSYTTGGESFTPSDAGMHRFMAVIPVAISADGYVPQWDSANDTVKVLQGDYDAAADGALIEVAAATDLTGKVRLICIGK